jgi:hypothetical protein
LLASLILWLSSLAFVAYRIPTHPGDIGVPSFLYTHPFTDLNAVVPKIAIVHQPEFFTVDYRWIYPAPCFFLYKFILHFNSYGHHYQRYGDIAFCSITGVGLLFPAAYFVSALVRQGLSRVTAWLFVLAAGLMSWPIMLAVHTGNIEAILWIGVAAASAAYYRRMYWTAAILLAIVGAFKIYPMLLLGLFLAPRKYWQIVLSLGLFAAISIASLAYIGPTVPIAYHNVANGMKSFTDLGFAPGMIDRNFLTFDHSLVSLIRLCTWHHPRLMVFLFRWYTPVAAVCMTVLFFGHVWKMPRLNQLFFIILAAVILPPKSYDYTLQMLYIPWAWLSLLAVNAAARSQRLPGLMPIMISVALLCSPEFFVRLHAAAYGQFKAVVLLVLLWLVTHYRFEDDLFPRYARRSQAL